MSNQIHSQFKCDIEALMAQVPAGQVTTYGDLAALAGHANAARVVGGVAHYGDETLPWHRLVNRSGGLAAGFYGGREVQAQLLEQEGIICHDDHVNNFKDNRWQPRI